MPQLDTKLVTPDLRLRKQQHHFLFPKSKKS